jgi:glycosyltransferase involved in cell wall biosynthesis
VSRPETSAPQPWVSIVIPAYNHAAYLPEAIDSVLAQSYGQVEAIVLDDGSTDDTRGVLARYTGRVIWETQPNMGQAATLNKGWRMARGTILAYLSADDRLEKDAASEAVRVLTERPDAVVCYPDFALIDPRSRTIRNVDAGAIDYRDMLLKVRCPIGPGAFFRRVVLERAGGWNASYRQMPDYDFWLRAGLLGAFVHIPRVLAGFRVHEQSQTFSRTTPERAMEPRVILSAFFARPALPEDIARLDRRAQSSAAIVSAQLHVRAGRHREAYACLRDAWRLSARETVSTNTARALLNALFNRLGHATLWKLKNLLAR